MHLVAHSRLRPEGLWLRQLDTSLYLTRLCKESRASNQEKPERIGAKETTRFCLYSKQSTPINSDHY